MSMRCQTCRGEDRRRRPNGAGGQTGGPGLHRAGAAELALGTQQLAPATRLEHMEPGRGVGPASQPPPPLEREGRAARASLPAETVTQAGRWCTSGPEASSPAPCPARGPPTQRPGGVSPGDPEPRQRLPWDGPQRAMCPLQSRGPGRALCRRGGVFYSAGEFARATLLQVMQATRITGLLLNAGRQNNKILGKPAPKSNLHSSTPSSPSPLPQGKAGQRDATTRQTGAPSGTGLSSGHAALHKEGRIQVSVWHWE